MSRARRLIQTGWAMAVAFACSQRDPDPQGMGGQTPEEFAPLSGVGGQVELGGSLPDDEGSGGRKVHDGGAPPDSDDGASGGQATESAGGQMVEDGAAGAQSSGGSGGTEGTGGEPSSGGSGGGETQEPCCGCLCADARWSCSGDNCLDENGHISELVDEAGFFEIPGGDYVSDGFPRTSPSHRLFYTFHAAQTGEAAPLALFFNGGPGSSTSTLMAANTAPLTLDPHVTGMDTDAVPNPLRWDRGMHLLHVDAPGTGFSYALPLPDGRTPAVGIDLDRDAAIFVRFLLGFLARHPHLRCNDIVLVGESYGGTRATLMLQHLLRPSRLSDATWLYFDPELAQLIAQHEQSTAACSADAAPIALQQQFATQVLIQPVVMGDVQWLRNAPNRTVCTASPYDTYQCDRPRGYMDAVWNIFVERLTTTQTLDEFLGVDPRTIDWFYPKQRALAYGRSPLDALAPTDLIETFGNLPNTDVYHIDFNPQARAAYGDAGSSTPTRWWTDVRLAAQFIENLRTVRTLITQAPFDMVVDSSAIVRGLATVTSLVQEVSWVDDATSERPQWVRVRFVDEQEVFIRMPVYASAGHAVTTFASGQLFDDTMQLLIQAQPSPPLLATQRVFPTLAQLGESAVKSAVPHSGGVRSDAPGP